MADTNSLLGAIPEICQLYIKDNMKNKITIHLAKHLATGAEVPMIVKKTDENGVIVDYEEFMKNRRGFTLTMLQNRWDKCREDAIALLVKYEVPGHLTGIDPFTLPEGILPIDCAIFFEEYIKGLEKKEGLKHTKLKSKKVNEIKMH